jgi:hypothetical protein
MPKTAERGFTSLHAEDGKSRLTEEERRRADRRAGRVAGRRRGRRPPSYLLPSLRTFYLPRADRQRHRHGGDGVLARAERVPGSRRIRSGRASSPLGVGSTGVSRARCHSGSSNMRRHFDLLCMHRQPQPGPEPKARTPWSRLSDLIRLPGRIESLSPTSPHVA